MSHGAVFSSNEIPPWLYQDNQYQIEQHITKIEEEQVYCICRRPSTKDTTMVSCTVCDEWYHPECIGWTGKENRKNRFICHLCKPEASTFKRAKISNSAHNKNSCIHCEKQKAMLGSSFCSNECAIAYSIEQLKGNRKAQKLERKHTLELTIRERYRLLIQIITDELSVGKKLIQSELDDLQIINEIDTKLAELNISRKELEVENSRVKDAMAYARKKNVTIDETGRERARKKMQVSGDIIDCFGCGKSCNLVAFARHCSSCFAKLELDDVTGILPSESEDGANILHCDYYDRTTKTYCKKLKASCIRHSGLTTYRSKKKENILICGCPQVLGEHGEVLFCAIPRNVCIKHMDWENIKQANIMLLEFTYVQKEKQLKHKHKVTAKRMVERRGLLNDRIRSSQYV